MTNRIFAKVDPLTLKVIVLSIIFGFLAGIIGEIFVETYILPPSQDLQNQILINDLSEEKEKNKEDISVTTDIDEALYKVKTSVVSIYNKKDFESKDVLNQIYLSSELLGQGFVLTSDGWILTNQDVVGSKVPNDIAINIDNKIYTVEKLEIDELTKTVLLKIDAHDLPVIVMGDKEDLKLGETVFVMNFSKDVFVTRIKELEYKDILRANDVILSTEGFAEFILVKDSLDNIYQASPLVNLRGEVVGIMMDEQKFLPLDFIKPFIDDTLRGMEVARPFLGIKYIDLTKAVGVLEKDRQGLSQGALVYSILKNSPAEKAGINIGDIITKVNGDEVNKKDGFVELIQEYEAGDTIDIFLKRNSEEIQIEVELGLL